MVDLDPTHWPDAIADLRSLAGQGRLAAVARSATDAQRVRLSGAAFALAWPIVFSRVTRVYEQRRGHRTCAVAVDRLADGCLDRFYDDVEAVVDDLLTHSTTKIANPEGWMTSRLRAVTVDAHRRRRGARGALQRPRLPAWLVRRLPGEPWYQQLAVEILTWVGVPTTAGTQLWPLDAWAEHRARATGDPLGSDVRAVQRDVEQVLAAMLTRPRWYDDHVERPLGRKTPPLAPMIVEGGSVAEPPPLVLADPDATADARLADLASLALAAIEQQLADDPQDEAAIGRIIAEVFGRIDTSADFAGAAGPLDGRPVEALVTEPAELHRIVQAVRGILDGMVAAV
ncbi:hypothetical protein Cs7R123_62880 [Catellatospora sp. TT07R-123]|uniref:hypothetical protein n=1 Tax=Catellatospora sp. TT07R-123 TaxID=2733863 RepID=UPI001AFE0778|nr:hypothetical protein [Catellatospora sp. TT07R-123]GHJ48946.1 hypothetical protein Cs7R123_62880 [Catellatospora sp. TT07R-123]